MTKVIKYDYNGSILFETDEKLFNTYFQYPAIKTSPWFKNMTHYHPDLPEEILKEASQIKKDRLIKNFVDKAYGGVKKLFALTTAKKCPAIIDYLNQCLVVIAPCDIEIEVGDTEIEYKSAESELISVSSHPLCQYLTKSKSTVIKPQGNLFKDYINVKFAMPFIFKNNQMPSMFLEPLFHVEPKLRYVNAAFVKETAINHTFQINTFARRNEGIIKFKKGEALVYLWYPEKVNFEKSKIKLGRPLRHRFKSAMSNLHLK